MGLLPVRIDPPTLISFYLRQGYGGQVGGQVYVPYLFYCLAPALAEYGGRDGGQAGAMRGLRSCRGDNPALEL